MIRFNSDYCEGAHPRILEALVRTNLEQTPGYGEDVHCAAAAARIKQLCGRDDLSVHFLVGGTQTNTTVLAAILKPYQGAIACDTGHINVHETGAIEATGHRVLALPSETGKLNGDMVREYCRLHFADDSHEHMVMPGAVYISNSTEIGGVYSAADLRDLRAACDEYSLALFLDGARLGYAMASEGSDATLPVLCETCDVFYIGGTKQGALFGEAVVFTNLELARNFRYMIKQRGGMLAKGRLLGIQFEELLRDDLYMELSRHAVSLAMKIKAAVLRKGLSFSSESASNQQFVIFPDDMLKKLSEKYAFSVMNRVDDRHTVARICTSWATREEDVDALVRDIELA